MEITVSYISKDINKSFGSYSLVPALGAENFNRYATIHTLLSDRSIFAILVLLFVPVMN